MITNRDHRRRRRSLVEVSHEDTQCSGCKLTTATVATTAAATVTSSETAATTTAAAAAAAGAVRGLVDADSASVKSAVVSLVERRT